MKERISNYFAVALVSVHSGAGCTKITPQLQFKSPGQTPTPAQVNPAIPGKTHLLAPGSEIQSGSFRLQNERFLKVTDLPAILVDIFNLKIEVQLFFFLKEEQG